MSNYKNRLKSYNSYSGCDMIATLQVSSHSGLKNHIYTLGSLQTISISTHQDKRPVRSLGNINAKEYTMGQRTIAGSLVFAVFDKHFADDIFKDSLASVSRSESRRISTIILPDELPPFDITISYANEYGHTSRMALYGVRLINEGQVMSINDIYTENTYQFVATALEPLNKDENIGRGQKNNTSNKITSPARTIPGLTEDIDTIINSYNNGNEIYQKDKLYLSVEVENPNTATGTGIARFSLEPRQKTGKIKIYGPSNELHVIQLENNHNRKTHSINLSSGNYYAFYESIEKTSNTVTFKIDYESTVNYISDSGPIIDYITDKEACILSNNMHHDMAVCYNVSEDNALIDTVPLKSKKALFSMLTPNTVYEFLTYSSNHTVPPSLATQSKTLKYETEMIDEFKTYMLLNQELLTNDIDDITTLINENTSSIKHIYNIVDFALSLQSKEDIKSIKNEIIFYAVKFQNHINSDLNKYASIQPPMQNLANPYYNTIDIPNDVEYCNIFKTDRGKSIFKEKISKVQSYEYIDKPNLRYYVYGVNNHSRGPKYDFVCFSADAKNDLIDYSSTNELASLSTDVISNTYPGVSSVNITRLAAEHFKNSNIAYLSKPMITVNYDLSLDICLNYEDCIKNEEEIVICFSEAKEVLDATPRKKIKFKYKKNIHVSSFHSGIRFNSSYAVWIENTNGFIISKIETFNTYLSNTDIEIEDVNIKTKQLEKEIDSIKNRLSQKIDIKTELNEIIESEKYNYDSHESVIYDNLIANIIYNEAVLGDTFDIIAKLLEVKSDKDIFLINNFNVKLQYNQTNNKVKFVCDRHVKISNMYIDDTTGEISKTLLAPVDNTVELHHSHGYTVLFCIADGLYANSGFIIIDNKTKNYSYYNITAEVI